MTKILGIGLPKTATTSLEIAMKKLGFSSIHLPFSYEEIDSVEFSNDITVASRFDNLDKIYKDPLFIYTIREKNDWATSAEKWFNRKNRNSWLKDLKKRNKNSYAFLDMSFIKIFSVPADKASLLRKSNLIYAYESFNNKINKYFSTKSNRLLLLDVFSSKPYSKLVDFLESKKKISFPIENRSI